MRCKSGESRLEPSQGSGGKPIGLGNSRRFAGMNALHAIVQPDAERWMAEYCAIEPFRATQRR